MTKRPFRRNRFRTAPALGVFALLFFSAIWAPPTLRSLNAEDNLARVGSVAACTFSEDSENKGRDASQPEALATPKNIVDLGGGNTWSSSDPGGGGNADSTFYLRADGTATTKTAAIGCDSPATAMSISTHNSQSFSPGDLIILCDDGGVFRETLNVTSSGSMGSPITYRGRSTAVVSGSDLVQGWTPAGTNKYLASVFDEPQQVFINGQFGDRKDGTSQLTNNLDWYWSQDTLYLYSSSGDPDTAYQSPGVEASARDHGISVVSKNHITIDGVTARHANKNGIHAFTDDYLTIRNSIVEWNYHVGIRKGTWPNGNHDHGLIDNNVARWNGSMGIGIGNDHTDNVIRRNVVYENAKYQDGRDSEHIWTGGIKMWGAITLISRTLIEDNEVYDNGPLSNFDKGRGVGIWVDECSGAEGPNIVRRNLVYDNRSHGIFIEKSYNTIVSYNLVVNNASTTHSGGISVRASLSSSGGDNTIHNNTIYGTHYFGIMCGVYDTGSRPQLHNHAFVNNIVVGSTSANLFAENACINDGYYGSGNWYAYNSFGVASPGFIRWGTTNLNSYSEFDAVFGSSTYSITQDPGIANPAQSEFWLDTHSACIDTGSNMGTTADGDGLQPISRWPRQVRTSNQDQHGAGWEVGAYVMTPPVFIPPPTNR